MTFAKKTQVVCEGNCFSVVKNCHQQTQGSEKHSMIVIIYKCSSEHSVPIKGSALWFVDFCYFLVLKVTAIFNILFKM